MSKVYLEPDQYVMYDEDGTVLGQRGVKVHSLSEKSMSGPGVCAVLRTGFEENTMDGVGVSLTITDDQLNELGYLTKAQVEQEIREAFGPMGDFSERAAGRRTALDILALRLGFDTPYKVAEPEPVKSDEPVNFLGGDVTMEELNEALKRSNMEWHTHYTSGYRCVFENTLLEAVKEIRKEKARPKFAYCGECRQMVNPFVSAYNDDDWVNVPYHDYDLEVFCNILNAWMPAYREGKKAHGLDSACVNMDPPAHPKVVEALVATGIDVDDAW